LILEVQGRTRTGLEAVVVVAIMMMVMTSICDRRYEAVVRDSVCDSVGTGWVSLRGPKCGTGPDLTAATEIGFQNKMPRRGAGVEDFTLSKSLLTGLTYLHDWGFVPSTKADDGDPLDIMVIHDATTFPGIVLTCRIIGILQNKKVDQNACRSTSQMILEIASIGTERITPGIPHIQNRKTSAGMWVWRESLRTHAAQC
jgi:hypothetical protein